MDSRLRGNDSSYQPGHYQLGQELNSWPGGGVQLHQKGSAHEFNSWASRIWFLLIPFVLMGCYGKKTPPVNQPYETLETITTEVLLHQSTDTYRLPFPVDAGGKNLFTNAIVRLDAWSKVHPGQYLDILNYTKGLCHEKLGHLKEAADCYGAVNGSDPDLVPKAAEKKKVMLDLDALFRPPLQSNDPTEQETLMEAARDRTEQAVTRYKGTNYESLAMLCAENRALEEFLSLKSRRSQVGETIYREAIESFITRFPESKRIQEHSLRLGGYYEESARESIARAEAGITGRGTPGGNQDEWMMAQRALDKATEIYVKVAQADGYPEKREAQARLDEIEELARKIERNR